MMSTDFFGLAMVAITVAMQLRPRVSGLERSGWLGLLLAGLLITQLDTDRNYGLLSWTLGICFTIGNALLVFSFYRAHRTKPKI